MPKKFTPFKLTFLFSCTLLFIVNNKTIAQVTSLSESFDNVIPAGWVAINHSTNGSSGSAWFQGDSRQFNAYSGTDNSYAAANYQSVGRSGNGTINNWLITPELNLTNGGAITFYSRTVSGSKFADRLEIRLSTNGTSTNVGSGVGDVGDFSTVLEKINSGLDVGGYPDTGWTAYIVAIPPGSSVGRVGLRYYVTNGGSTGTNSNYIGIDEFSYQSTLPVTLFNFMGKVKDNKALLTWSTANEINNKGFEVELSRDNKTFTSIGFVSAAKSSGGINNYSFADNKLLSGTNYYRLKQIDNDGASKYSTVVKLELQKFAWDIFGNSSNNSWIQLQMQSQANVAIQIVSINGKLIQTINKGSIAEGTYNIPLNMGSATHGIYVIKLMIDKSSYTKKLMR